MINKNIYLKFISYKLGLVNSSIKLFKLNEAEKYDYREKP